MAIGRGSGPIQFGAFHKLLPSDYISDQHRGNAFNLGRQLPRDFPHENPEFACAGGSPFNTIFRKAHVIRLYLSRSEHEKTGLADEISNAVVANLKDDDRLRSPLARLRTDSRSAIASFSECAIQVHVAAFNALLCVFPRHFLRQGYETMPFDQPLHE